ncbi:FtsW/RodA/SpoVE family cell cycle protein, partial [bacterium]|nr:FtsW/RodA/SpoVE family cell cycle protein [bacterium]
MRLRTPHLRPRDWLLVAVMGVLLTIGAAFVHSASYRSGPMGEGYYTTSPLKQVQWIVIGGFAFVAVLFVNYRILVEHGAVFYAVGIGQLAYVLKFGVSSETIVARRWIQVGPIRAQPSELMKVLVILAMARLLMYNDKHRTLGGLLAPFA